MSEEHTRKTLAEDLRRLGVERGDVLFIHSSFKSLGTVAGGAAAVVGALEDAVGAEGTLLMPSFNLVEGERRFTSWNPSHTPSTTGWLTEFFRQMPGTVRSDHYSHSVAARGKNAEQFAGGHRRQEGSVSPWDHEPWGKTFGTHSPYMKAYRAGGKILMLGVDYSTSTYMHLVEVMHWNERLQRDPQVAFAYIGRNRPLLGDYWDSLGHLRRGKVGDAESRLFPISIFVDTLLEAVRAHPETYYRGWTADKA